MTTPDQPTGLAALRQRLVVALDAAHRTHPCPLTRDTRWSGCLHYDEKGRVIGVGSCHSGRRADAVLAVLSEPAGHAAMLLELEARYRGYARDAVAPELTAAYASVADDLQRLAAEAEAAGESVSRDATAESPADLLPEAAALAPMFEELARVIATSSRDWGRDRVDAWLWAVLVGWDCEQFEHDDTCTHGTLEEMAERHGWDDATVAKARRYRAAVHHQPNSPA